MSEKREPFIVHCGECNHEWVAFYTPCPFIKAADMMLHMKCPMCMSDPHKIFCGPAPKKSEIAPKSVKG
jgi:hypothetical protein